MSESPRRIPKAEQRTLRGLGHRLLWWGERTDAPIVLLHGWGDCSDTWQFLVDCLPDEHTYVALDWRGFGGSEWPVEGYWFPDYFADLEVLLSSLCASAPARVIAHSMGGNIASMYGGIRPQRIEWMVNLEGIGLPPTKHDQAPARYAEWLDQVAAPPRPRVYKSLAPLADFIVQRNPFMPRHRAEFLAAAWTRVNANGDYELSFDPRHRNTNPVLYQREEAEACWRCFEAPMLILLAEQSEIRGRIDASHGTDAYFHSLYRDVRVITLANAGHMMHLDAPEVVASHIESFMRAHAARRLLPSTF